MNRRKTDYLQNIDNLSYEELENKVSKLLLEKIHFQNHKKTREGFALMLQLANVLSQSTTGTGPAPDPEEDFVQYGNILFVSPDGDNSTAEKGVLARPYKDLEAAEAQAIAGDLIYVFPGNYAVSSYLGTTGVDWHFLQGAVISRS